MKRYVLEWGGYLVVTAALVVGMNICATLPVTAQQSLPFGSSTWMVLWAVLGVWSVAFIYLERRYPRSYVVLSMSVYLLSWLSWGLRFMEWGDSYDMMIDVLKWLSSAAALVVLAVVMARGGEYGDK
ncbi:hypothetical protein [Bifidobacterium eulemuris]|uniref:Uncharacterized protein n=1 Tax=Bifidobacterium eulemuris TaxID=1765219 RepID=A0A261FYM3_9BIFI|nr:hypothetical protein [Bifidobacterium eulemuris]OZG64247.1 hypothetical protein BEUL_2208 [Bifidobacterium eulemuris]QOL32826.1 hypothetical protein BE0216_10560 [Bifidobacterium eulemuris]